MRLRAVGPLLLAATLLVSGCGGSDADDPTPTQAAKAVSGWMDELKAELTHGLRPLRPWQVTADGSRDQKAGCEDGRARRTYAATLDVPARGTPPDPDNAETLLTGQLLGLSWDPSESSNDDTSGTVTAKRKKADRTGTKLTIDFSPVPGGWHYVATARTACLATD